MADELGGQATSPETTSAAAAPPPSSPSPAPAPAPASTAPPSPSSAGSALPGDGRPPAGGPAASGPAGAPESWTGIRDALRQYDPRVADGFPSDEAALQQLLLAYRRAQDSAPLVQYGQLYMQHADKFQAYLRQQQEESARQQQAQAAQKKWFQLPEFDPSWRQLVRRGDNGELLPAAGAPPDIPGKFMTYAHALENLQNKFWSDPQGTIGPLIEHIATEKAREIVGQHLGQYQDRNVASEFVRQNSGWIHQHDAQGNVVYDQSTGREALSPWGQKFVQHVQQAQQMGIVGVEAQRDHALTKVQLEAALLRLQGQGAAQQGDAAKQQFLAQAQGAQHQPNHGGSLPAGNALNPTAQPSQNRSLTLKERLRRDFDKNGVTDKDVAQTIGAGTRG